MKQTFTTIADALRNNQSRLTNLVLLGTLIVGSNITKEGIRKLLRTYCKEDYAGVDKEKIVEDFYHKGKQIVPKRNSSKNGLI